MIALRARASYEHVNRQTKRATKAGENGSRSGWAEAGRVDARRNSAPLRTIVQGRQYHNRKRARRVALVEHGEVRRECHALVTLAHGCIGARRAQQ